MIKTFEEALAEVKKFEALQSSLSKWGAADTEPRVHFEHIMIKVLVKGFAPQEVLDRFTSENPWEVYSSIRGWRGCVKKLDAAVLKLAEKLNVAPHNAVTRLIGYYGWDT